MKSNITKNKWETKSENYFVCIKIKSNKKDGEYYDIVFGLKGQKNREMHAHYGMKAFAEKGIIGHKIFFIEPRQATSHYREQRFNAKTGEFLSELDIPFDKVKGETGARLYISTEWDDKAQKLFIRKVEIIENTKTQ